MSFYERRILPRLVNCVWGSPVIEHQRRLVVPKAKGRVLEIGFGTGLNLAHYDRTLVKWIWALEPSARPPRSAVEPTGGRLSPESPDVRLDHVVGLPPR